MMRCCDVRGCLNEVTRRWGSYCNKHRIRNVRHGHPEQETITKTILAPYIKIVRKRLDKNLELVAALAQAWEDTLEQSRRYLRDVMDRGVPHVRAKREAAQELVKLAQWVEPREIMETACAVGVLAEFQPGRFTSDRGFWFQLARRCRGLAEVNAGSWYDHTSGKTKRVYRDLSPRTTLALGQTLGEVFGTAGMMIARKAMEDAQAREKTKKAVHDALGAMA